MRDNFIKFMLIAVLTIQLCSARNSRILGKLKEFLPNFTEIGMVTNIINVYFQVSQFVRSTNQIISNMKAVKSDIELARKEILQIYSTCKSLKEISLYDMDTWSTTIRNLNWVVSHEIYDVIGAFGLLEYHTVDATVDYLDELHSIKEFDMRKRKTEQALDNIFLDERYVDALGAFNIGRKEYYSITLATLQNTLVQKQLEYVQTGNEEIKEELGILTKRIKSIEKRLEYSLVNVERIKLDTLIEEAKQLIAVNLIEVQEMEKQVVKYEEASANLIDAYNKLNNNQVSTWENRDSIITEFKKNGEYSNHPNQVEEPETPEELPYNKTPKKDASSQDILSLQNGIAFLLYKQECLIRDISGMKCNTMAFILSLEAFLQDMEETQGVVVATHSKALSTMLESIK